MVQPFGAAPGELPPIVDTGRAMVIASGRPDDPAAVDAPARITITQGEDMGRPGTLVVNIPDPAGVIERLAEVEHNRSDNRVRRCDAPRDPGDAMAGTALEERVVRSAEALLAEQQYVSAVDVLVRLGWLAPAHVDHWRQGRADCLERMVQANLAKTSKAMAHLRRWAARRGLVARETAYVARSRDRRPLRFSISGRTSIERAYRTHWVSPELSAAKRDRLVERASKPPDLVVVAPLKEWTCTSCSGTGDLLLMQDPGPVCMDCAGLGHLVFLPAGDTGLTRRAHKASELSAVVVRFSRARKRYERQGLLVEQDARDAAGGPSAEGRRSVQGADAAAAD